MSERRITFPNRPAAERKAILAQAREMRDAGASWREIVRATGVPMPTLQMHIDPNFNVEAYRKKRRESDARHREKHYEAPKGHRPHSVVLANIRSDAAARLAEIPPDTRTITGVLFGDPIFERSALGRELATKRGARP